MTGREQWKLPPELALYARFANYPGRAEELMNSNATYHNNVIVAAMACETAAQFDLLARLRRANLLLHPDDANVLCPECKRTYENSCPDCGACEAGCSSDGNTCPHPNVVWGRKETEKETEK